MFDPQRLLGQLMGDALSGQFGSSRKKKKSGYGGYGGAGGLGSLSTGTKAKLGLGLLGVAVAAYQHYQAQQPASPAPQPLSGTGLPPAAPGTAVPPPPPGAAAIPAAMPPPPPGTTPTTPARSEHAMLLLRAMITAADADGLIDDDERAAILGRARDAGFDEETLAQLDMEVRAPLTLAQLAVRTPPELREEVYVAALVAITADTDAERAFLDELAARIGLGAGDRTALHARFGIAAGAIA